MLHDLLLHDLGHQRALVLDDLLLHDLDHLLVLQSFVAPEPVVCTSTTLMRA